jgi:hypothetical protein
MDLDRRGLRLLLPDHHRRLDARCRALLGPVHAGARAPGERWLEVETELNEHMLAEETLLLPGYAVFAPEDARSLAAEHAQLRALMHAVGEPSARYETYAARLRQLLDALDAHAQHEDASLYPWAQANLMPPTVELRFTRICRWFGILRDPSCLAAS